MDLGLKIARGGTAAAAALALGGCPSNTSTHLVSLDAPPAWAIEYRHGTIVGSPTTFIQSTYRVRSGDKVVWQIDLAAEDPACDAFAPEPRDKKFPAGLRYGETPSCYRQSVAPRPLEEGHCYRFESDDPRYNHSLHVIGQYFMVEAGRVKPISQKRYRETTGAE